MYIKSDIIYEADFYNESENENFIHDAKNIRVLPIVLQKIIYNCTSYLF